MFRVPGQSIGGELQAVVFGIARSTWSLAPERSGSWRVFHLGIRVGCAWPRGRSTTWAT